MIYNQAFYKINKLNLMQLVLGLHLMIINLLVLSLSQKL